MVSIERIGPSSLDGVLRWQVYERLQSLAIACRCQAYEPLQVEVNTPLELVQVWSVVQQIAGDRPRLIERLQRSWQIPCARNIVS